MMAVVMAAGRGSRMGALTSHTPKPLLPVQGRPLLEHALLGLRDAGVSEAIVVTGWLGEMVEEEFRDRPDLAMSLRFVRQPVPDGTGRALQAATPWLRDESFLVCWGDILIDPPGYAALVREFENHPCDVLLGLNPVDDPWRGAAVYLGEDERVIRLEEKPARGTSTTNWNNAGVFLARPALLDYAVRLIPSARGEYELPQAIANMIADGCEVRGYPLSGFWSDVGTPEDLAEAESTFRGRPRAEAS